jgi:hypothetical protein
MDKAKTWYASDMEPQHKKDTPMSLLPCGIRQGAAFRKDLPDSVDRGFKVLARIQIMNHHSITPEVKGGRHEATEVLLYAHCACPA